MSIKKSLFIVLVVALITWGLSNKNVYARLPEFALNSTNTQPQLSNEITISNNDNETYFPSVAYNWKHHEYMVVWHTKWAVGSRDIRGARISDTGQVLSTFIVYEDTTNDSAQPTIAYDSVNDRYLVVFIYDVWGDGSDWDLYGRFIPWDGPDASLNEFAICTWNTHQWGPKIAYGGTVSEFLVVWANEDQAGTIPMYISGRRITAADGSFPGSDSDLTISHTTENRVNPDLSYNSARNEYMVVYDNAQDIFGIRLTGDLNHNFGGEFAIAGWPGAEIHPAVAACRGANQYLVAWQSDQSASNDAIYARFIDGGGTIGNVYLIDDTTSPEQEPDVDCNFSGTQYFVSWQSRYTNLEYGIWGRLVEPDETLESEVEVVPPGSTASRTTPVIGGGHTNYLVVWEHERDGTSYQNIHGRLITPYKIFLPLILR